MARPGGAPGGLERRTIGVPPLSCGQLSTLFRLGKSEVSHQLLTVWSQFIDAPRTPPANPPLAGVRDQEHRSIAERDCGAGGRQSWKRRSGQPSEQKASWRKGPGQPGTELQAATDATDTERGRPRETEARSTLKAQIPQRIWMRGRRTGRPERRPLAMGITLLTRRADDGGGAASHLRRIALGSPRSSSGSP